LKLLITHELLNSLEEREEVKMTDINLFEIAARQKFRFPSNRGELIVEQLYDMPLSSKTGFDLDSVAKTVNTEMKSVTEDSFVATANNPRRAELFQKLELVKMVIAHKIAEIEKTNSRRSAAEERGKILNALEAKRDQKLQTSTEEDLVARLAELSAQS
jgi:hypothetical protein